MYCTVEQVQSDFKALKISSTTVLTADLVTEYIEESDAEIDSIIGVKFVTPVTDPTALLLCRRMSRALAVDRVTEKLTVKAADSNIGQNSQTSRRKEALDLAHKIATGEVAFGAAATLSQKDVSSLTRSSGTPTRVFSKDRKQW